MPSLAVTSNIFDLLSVGLAASVAERMAFQVILLRES